MLKDLIKLISMTILISCSVPAPTPAPTPVPTKYDWDNSDWDAALVAAIDKHGNNLLHMQPKDWNEYVAVWPTTREGLINFWARIFVTVAKFESGYKTESKYQEKFKSSSTGSYVVSRGLFQISKSSTEQARYGCKWKNEEELHDPLKNIECAVRVVNFLVGDNKRIAGKINGEWQGIARYFAVFRPTNSAYPKKAFEARK